MKKDKILDELLLSWENTYKKGQLTLWIFMALQEGKKYVDEIKSFIEEKSDGTITCEEQSLYRSLRKFEHIDVLAFEYHVQGFVILFLLFFVSTCVFIV
jgi:PadR family transcriptional regulator PadR